MRTRARCEVYISCLIDIFLGLVDSSGKISSFLQDANGFGVSGTANFVTNDYKFGLLMHFVPQ